MQTGYTGLLPSQQLYLWFLISAVLSSRVSSMDRNTTSSERPIRHSHGVCAGEQEYVQQRKQVVLDSLNGLGVNCTAEEVPHIALLASGGGQRAAVALVGSLSQLAQDGLLDTILYLSGVSGSTWSMASLYSNPDWSTNMDKAVLSLVSGQVQLEPALAWLSEKAQREYFSLSDVWGAVTAAGIMKQWDTRKLSEEAGRNTTNPYPIYGAIEKYCYNNGPTEGKWFEMTPHEVGFPELGLFVETSLLGSRFHGGVLMEKEPEMDIVQLQGVLGCALADEEMVKQFVPPWLNVPSYMDNTAEQYLSSYNAINKFIVLTKSYITNTAVLTHIDDLQTILEDKVNRNQSVLLESKNPDERKVLFEQWTMELQVEAEGWAHSLPDGPVKTHVTLLINKVIPLIIEWEWGTTRNFLYEYKEVPIPLCLHSKETFHLMDGGMLINVGYPSFLGEKRHIDLIIAPEYSAGDMFETLTLARDYAAKVNKPFPELDDKVLEQERDWPKDCYVFEGKEKEPTIVFMPLFNRQNCKGAEEFKQKMAQFSTFQRSYSPDMIEYVLETAKTNMKNNKEILLREINRALQRRKEKTQK